VSAFIRRGFLIVRVMPLLLLLFISSGYAAKTGYHDAIASAHPLATAAGMQVLSEGGNAFDAAVTVAAVLAVLEPYGSGIGGGGFWLLHRAEDGKQIMLDGRERAPLAANRDMYLDEQGNTVPGLSLNGALSAAIPGQVAAMVHIQQHYGSLPLQRLLEPAIRYAEQGFAVNDIFRKLAAFRLQVLKQYPAASKTFLQNGDVPAAGYVVKQPELAQTLRRIARYGRDGFYAGEVAHRLVSEVRAAGGIWSHRDLEQYRVIERSPLELHWQGMRITVPGLPSSGGIVLAQILNMLDHYSWEKLAEKERIHLVVEAMRRAYRDRAEHLGDSDHIDVDTDKLVSAGHAQALIENLDMMTATPSEFLPPVSVKHVEGMDTTHYSILDRSGNRVAATLSINYPFGSGYVVPGTGVLLNDEMDDFSIRPGTPNAYGLVGNEANAIAPGKRMLSSMTPTFIESDQRMLIVGTPGGSRIITMVLNAILGFAAGKDASEIVAMPRYHHQYLPDYIQLEPGALSQKIRNQLQLMGHNLQERASAYGNMQAVMHDYPYGKTTAASDPRGLGAAMTR
jgi:gamma-glutamyltranspeptidase/glutathione hydrolase